MLATFISFLAVLFIFLYPFPLNETLEFAVSIIFVASGSVILAVGPIASLLFALLLQQTEKEIVPGIAQVFKSQWRFKLALSIIFLFPLFSFSGGSGILNFWLPFSWIVGIWAILFGMTIDCLYYLARRSCEMIDPIEAIKLLSKQARRHLTPGEAGNFCRWVDALHETALKALNRSNISLCTRSLDELEQIFTDFLKGRTLLGETQQSEEELNYAICFFLQRIEQINQKSIECRLELICSKAIVSMGRVAIAISRYHPSWSSHPLNTLGKMAVDSLNADLKDVGVKAAITLQQVGKTVLDDDPTLQLPIQDLFFTIIEKLEKIAQTTFRRDKTTNINLLTHPFREIKHWFSQEKYKNHPDAPVIVRDIDRVMGQFEALEAILRTMPNIPKVTEEEENAEDE